MRSTPLLTGVWIILQTSDPTPPQPTLPQPNRHIASNDSYPSVGCWQVAGIVSDALFILLVEKDAAFMRLAEDRFYNTFPCIIITAKGQPDVASRWVQGLGLLF